VGFNSNATFFGKAICCLASYLRIKPLTLPSPRAGEGKKTLSIPTGGSSTATASPADCVDEAGFGMKVRVTLLQISMDLKKTLAYRLDGTQLEPEQTEYVKLLA
jgi:hypothetical protein